MDTENAIEVKGLKKRFKVYYDKGNSLKERALFLNRNKYETRWVLNGITFQVKKGEAVGLIGHNGCGKSTALKLLNRIIYPNGGSIEMRGRVSSLIELGAGFHPDMSGRENIYTNASIFGLTKKQIDARVDSIIAFSELGKFIHNPVRTYSSGMYMRLAFAVAINVDADILLIDEILAVGDANFQAKCFRKLREIKAAGTTVVIVSHSLEQIEKICDRTIWLHEGLIREDGKPKDVHLKYMNYMTGQAQQHEQAGAGKPKGASKFKETGNKKAEFTYVKLLDGTAGEEKQEFRTGDPLTLEAGYARNDASLQEAELGVWIVREDDVCCVGTNTQVDGVENLQFQDQGVIRIHFPSLALAIGRYQFTLTMRDCCDEIYHRIYEAGRFCVTSDRREFGVTVMEHSWNFDGHEAAAEKADTGLDADLIDIHIQAAMREYTCMEGENLRCHASITNHSIQAISTNRFYPVNLSYHLYDENGALLCFEGKRTLLAQSIGRDETKDFAIEIETEKLPAGRYFADLTMVQEGKVWFDSAGDKMKDRITVIVQQGGQAKIGFPTENLP